MLITTPLREPRANTISTNIFFFSHKMGRQVWCESNLEWDVALLLEHDPEVLEYCEQAVAVKWSKSEWIPDFVALIKHDQKINVVIIEVKYIQELIEKRTILEQKYQETSAWIQLHFPIMQRQIANVPLFSIDFMVVSDLPINSTFRVQNIRKLSTAHPEPHIRGKILPIIFSFFQNIPTCTIENLVKYLTCYPQLLDYTYEEKLETVHFMLYRLQLDFNLDNLIGLDTEISVIGRHPFQSIFKLFQKYEWKEYSPTETSTAYKDIYSISKDPQKALELWKEATLRLQIITPFLHSPIKDLKNQTFHHQKEKISWRTVYKWLLRYKNANGDVRALIPNYHQRGRKRAVTRQIPYELWVYGKDQYLQLERRSIKRAFQLMQAYAMEKNQLNHCMSYSSFRRRIQEIDEKTKQIHRIGKRNAEKNFELSESEFPHGDFALQSVQIDHTPIDVLVVDEAFRLVTERPYLTVAFDSHTRCVLGYYLTYDKPSRLSIAMTLNNCVQEKTQTLEKIRAAFPTVDDAKLQKIEKSAWKNVCGLPFTIHMDNGSDFTSKDIRLFGYAYQINLHYRAVKKPQHGAYVERFLGTLNHRLHSLRGSTFSNTQERMDYPAEKKATYTIQELEARILTEIVFYHEDYHRQIKMTPLEKWAFAFSNTNLHPSVSQNLTHIDFKTFKYDILPSEERTVQKSGVSLFGLQYSHPAIQKWIGSKDLINKKIARRFRIRYDPRDLRIVYFYDDHAQKYVDLKCSNKMVHQYFSNEPLTLWELRTIESDSKKRLNNPHKLKKQLEILNVQIKMDEITSSRTKSARIKTARKKNRSKNKDRFQQNPNPLFSNSLPVSPGNADDFKVTFINEKRPTYIPQEQLNPFYGITFPIRKKKKKLKKNENDE